MVTRKKSQRKTVVYGAWGYVRYSTAMQGENSAERQCQALERWAARTGVELVAVAYDPELSRTTEHAERPGLTKALDSVPPGGVLCAETVSRFAGDNYILGAIRRELRRRGARLATADETGDPDLDEDRQEFEAMFSRREIKQIRQRTKGALAVKKLRGELTGAPPFGMRAVPDPNGRTVPRTGRPLMVLVPDASEQAVIRRAKALSDEGLTVRAIAVRLEAEGIRNRRGKPLAFQTIALFLRPLLTPS